ncbi:glycosyltransferase [Prevotella sp. E9-3]|uniref:glycosyltransferase family 2 protein n=1 Tax=Prevotella sp. E9-3 TaxID=2913621 RepID=UPI001EDBFAF3|nr:glycosyltransferase family 2 protein [Prevotella sp. E9-3]UKK49073.1 glycosyltransferase [Prevotella sp. E9-3]
MKVSVILPVYNVGPYLEEALDSLCNQTLNDIEIIAVNDGSTDDSENILKKYASQDQRVRYYNQTNQGQSAARNNALQHAKGDYIYFMDSDDTIDSDALQRCYEYAEKTKADFIFFDGEIMQEKEAAPLAWNYHRTYLVNENIAYRGDELLNLMLDKQKHNCVVWLLFIRKVFLDGINLKFFNGIIHEDELFTVSLTLQSDNIYCLQQSLVKHRVRRSSTMGISYSQRNVNCYLTVIDELFRFQDSPLIRKYAYYTLSKVFYTAHLIPLKEKPAVFWRAIKSGYLKYIGWKSCLVFWLKQ